MEKNIPLRVVECLVIGGIVLAFLLPLFFSPEDEGSDEKGQSPFIRAIATEAPSFPAGFTSFAA